MLLELSQAPEAIETGVCVVGAGPAGITLARRLAASGTDVVLCEAGGLEVSPQSQKVYDGRTVGDPYFDLSMARLRYLGGSTGHWNGWCRPLDAHDFAPKAASPAMTAWPIGARDLEPFAAEARDILEIDGFRPDEPFGASGLNRISLRIAGPVRFGDKYRGELAAARNLRLLLHANLTGARMRGREVAALAFTDFEGRTRSVAARHFVVACGGIENSRLLLWLNAKGDLPLPHPGLVGRYWMEHHEATIGMVVVTDWDAFRFDEHAIDYFAPAPAMLERRRILNAHLYLKTTHYSDETKYLLAELLCVAPTLGKWAMDQFGKRLACVGHLKASGEQEPLHGNRVALGEERDRFGMPRTVLHWRACALDARSIRETGLAFAAHCARADIARVRLEPWMQDDGAMLPNEGDAAGFHHMGGTRMGEGASTGVVDRNCKVFGLPNLWVAGSSLFPSGGYANPTYTIVKLALRLGDHLSARVATR
ncbi:MAG: GMC oxidoreductase [Hyphomicrobiales bacterium]